jgi:predicted Zn-dependent protease
VENLRLAQKLDGYGTSAPLLEAALFGDFLAKRIQYPALAEEILAPLRRAEKNDPCNPFLKLRQAVVLREFGRGPEARRLALAALDLEPEYAAALLFLHELAGLPADDPALLGRIARIRAQTKALKARPGSYLFKLSQLPGGTGAGE